MLTLSILVIIKSSVLPFSPCDDHIIFSSEFAPRFLAIIIRANRWVKLIVADGREDGVRRDSEDGRHGTVLRGAAGGHEATLGRRRSPGVLRSLQRVPAQRFCQIVSTDPVLSHEKLLFVIRAINNNILNIYLSYFLLYVTNQQGKLLVV